MKTSTVPALAFLAVLAAFVLFPLSLPAATAALSAVGLVWILSAEYATALPPLGAPSAVKALPGRIRLHSLPHAA